jgi:hypothetical protein
VWWYAVNQRAQHCVPWRGVKPALMGSTQRPNGVGLSSAEPKNAVFYCFMLETDFKAKNV